MVRFYPSHRSTLFRLLQTLEIKPTSQDTSPKTALDFILKHQSAKADFLPGEISTAFAGEQWQRLISVKVERQSHLARGALELCALSYLATELKCGDMAVTGSESWSDYRDQLLPWSEFEPRLEEYCKASKNEGSRFYTGV